MRILHFGPTDDENGPFSLLTGFGNLGHIVETCDIVGVADLKKKPRRQLNS